MIFIRMNDIYLKSFHIFSKAYVLTIVMMSCRLVRQLPSELDYSSRWRVYLVYKQYTTVPSSKGI